VSDAGQREMQREQGLARSQAARDDRDRLAGEAAAEQPIEFL